MTTPASVARTFAYEGYVIAVRTASAATVEWLDQFQAPWFEARRADAPPLAPVVELRVDAELFRRRAAAACPTGRDVACFTMDRAEARLPLVRIDGGPEIALDAAGGTMLEVRGDDRRTRVEVLADAERPAGRLAVLRVLRELASAAALRRGELPIHGAAVADADGVTLFVGAKGAGKSSLLVHALLHPGTQFVANDRAFVRVGAGGAASAHGMPTIVAIREGTLALAARLRDAVGSGAWHYASTVAEARGARAAGAPVPGAGTRWPPGLSPAQLCAILGVDALAGGTVARIVFTEIDTRSTPAAPFSLRRLSPDEASARLLESGLVAGGRTATFLAPALPPARAALERAAGALASAVPSLGCVLGSDAYAAPSVWQAIRAGAAIGRSERARV